MRLIPGTRNRKGTVQRREDFSKLGPKVARCLDEPTREVRRLFHGAAAGQVLLDRLRERPLERGADEVGDQGEGVHQAQHEQGPEQPLDPRQPSGEEALQPLQEVLEPDPPVERIRAANRMYYPSPSG
jgi:hypothetical protein